jgi:hypothetical protein
VRIAHRAQWKFGGSARPEPMRYGLGRLAEASQTSGRNVELGFVDQLTINLKQRAWDGSASRPYLFATGSR